MTGSMEEMQTSQTHTAPKKNTRRNANHPTDTPMVSYVHSTSMEDASDSHGHATSSHIIAESKRGKIYNALHRKQPQATAMTTLLTILAGYAFSFAASFITIVMGATMRGDWIIILLHFLKQSELPVTNETKIVPEISDYDVFGQLDPRFSNAHIYISLSVATSFAIFFTLGGFLQWFYYIRRQDQASVWKCQPNRWLSAENERHEILLGSFNMAVGGTVSGMIACFALNGGHTTMYFSAFEYGWLYLPVSMILHFLFVDIVFYYSHRILHMPAFYKHMHKLHHRYHAPTAFSTTAMHPIEFLYFQCVLAAPIFFIPIYSGVFIINLSYIYYYGMIDHSGIKMDALWPWQPSSKFHDDHHRYFHTNFGLNLHLWDLLHDTLCQKDRTYGENIFYGRGMKKAE